MIYDRFSFYRSPSKAKKSKAFKFPSKSKDKRDREKSRDKDKSEKDVKEKDKESASEGKDKEKKKDKDKKEKEKKEKKEKDKDKDKVKDKDKDKKEKKLKQSTLSEEILELGGNAQFIANVALYFKPLNCLMFFQMLTQFSAYPWGWPLSVVIVMTMSICRWCFVTALIICKSTGSKANNCTKWIRLKRNCSY